MKLLEQLSFECIAYAIAAVYENSELHPRFTHRRQYDLVQVKVESQRNRNEYAIMGELTLAIREVEVVFPEIERRTCRNRQ